METTQGPQTTLEEKRERAIKYLRERKLYRADLVCAHQYEKCSHHPAPVVIEVSRNSVQQNKNIK